MCNELLYNVEFLGAFQYKGPFSLEEANRISEGMLLNARTLEEEYSVKVIILDNRKF